MSNIFKVAGLQKELYKKSLFFIYSLRSFDLSLKNSDVLKKKIVMFLISISFFFNYNLRDGEKYEFLFCCW